MIKCLYLLLIRIIALGVNACKTLSRRCSDIWNEKQPTDDAIAHGNNGLRHELIVEGEHQKIENAYAPDEEGFQTGENKDSDG